MQRSVGPLAAVVPDVRVVVGPVLAFRVQDAELDAVDLDYVTLLTGKLDFQ